MKTNVLLISLFVCANAYCAPGAPSGLLCELLPVDAPTLITTATPHFSWIVEDESRGARQNAFQIQVASDMALLEGESPDFWDSGRIESGDSIAVAYAGKGLASNSSYFWHVRTWDIKNEPSPYSQSFRFFTSDLLLAREWTGQSRWCEVKADGKPTWMLENRRAMVREQDSAVRSSHEKPGRRHSYHFWDFGRASFGSVRLAIDCKESGELLTIRVGENLRKECAIDREPGGNITYREFDVELKQGLHEYRIMPKRHKGPIPLPDHLGEVCPFQYVEVEGLPADYDRALLKRDTVVYPMTSSDAGVFKSSDSNLVRVWDLCQYTMKATNFLGVYIDGERERIPYEADALINQYAYYCVDREYAISRYSWQYLTRFPTWPTEWILQTPLMAWADYMQTGQSNVLAQSYTDLQAKCLQGLAREDGLISTLAVNSNLQKEFGKPDDAVIQKSINVLHPAYRQGKNSSVADIVDWPKGEREGYEFRPVNTVVNAFYYRALVTMAGIASALGKTEDADGYTTEADRVCRAFNDSLFDPSQGLYLDGEGATHFSPHANMFALALGLVPKDRQASVVAFIRQKGMFPSVYGAQWLLDALYDVGEAEHALTLMNSRNGDRTWMNMIENVGATIAMEAWDMKYKPNSDWNHAWGAAPADIIPRKLMGIEPIEPGFRKARIKPQIGSLKWAEGKVPTIRGFVEVSVAREVDGGTAYKVVLPANMTAELWLPARDADQIMEGGKPLSVASDIHLLRQQDGYVILEISAGRYAFVVKP